MTRTSNGPVTINYAAYSLAKCQSIREVHILVDLCARRLHR
jgi:hypothetical protein